MKRRHSGHMNSGAGNNRRPHGGQQNRYGFQKPRKNYPALREKYLNMAKDAMSAGDRVLAEYYLQHADHYFRMQQEFLAERAQRQQMNPQEAGGAEEGADETGPEAEEDVSITNNSNVLPAYLTRPVAPASESAPQEKAAATTGWEEE